jgi:Zn-dependent protease with chaperone function
VVLGNGVINAFASGHGRRRYLIIHSDLFEVGGQARNPEVLRFVIGHEVGHIAAGHTSFARTLVIAFTSGIPVLGPAMSRAQEYTADNHAYSYCPEGAASCMSLFGAGKYLLGQVDFRALCDRATIERGFFVWLVNLQASHPVLLWRAAALADRTRSGRVFFRPGDTPPARQLQAPHHTQPQPYGQVHAPYAYGQVSAQYAAYEQAPTVTPAAPYRPPASPYGY